MDPKNKQTEGVLLRQLHEWQGDRSKNIKVTAAMIQKLDTWKDEFADGIGKEADMKQVNLVLWQIIDDDTHDRLISKGLEQYEASYEEVAKFILQQIRRGEEREVLRRPAKRDKDKDGDVQMFNLARQERDNPTQEAENESEEED